MQLFNLNLMMMMEDSHPSLPDSHCGAVPGSGVAPNALRVEDVLARHVLLENDVLFVVVGGLVLWFVRVDWVCDGWYWLVMCVLSCPVWR